MKRRLALPAISVNLATHLEAKVYVLRYGGMWPHHPRQMQGSAELSSQSAQPIIPTDFPVIPLTVSWVTTFWDCSSDLYQ